MLSAAIDEQDIAAKIRREQIRTTMVAQCPSG
jgi:hypothetical protein